MSVYYRYALGGTNIVVLYYVDECVHWYTSEALGKWFIDTIAKRFHINFLVYASWFMSIIISHMKDDSISVNQARYSTYIVAKYLDTATVKASTKFYKTTLPYYIIFAKNYASTSDEQVQKLTRKFNIHYRSPLGP